MGTETNQGERVYRVGIVGCGGMGRVHAKAFQSHPRAVVVAAADVSPEAVNGLADAFDLDAKYLDHQEMFDREKLDIVCVATWQNVRAEITISAADAGIAGILGEKPMCASLGEADDMIAACEGSGSKLAIGHQRRFTAQNTEARTLIQEGAIGTPTAMFVRDTQGLLNRGTHSIDTMMYLLGDPRPVWVIGQVSRKTDRWERRVRCEDLCMGLICFEGGFRGVYECDMPEPGLRGDVVYGSEGTLLRDRDGGILLLNSDSAGWQSISPRLPETTQHQEFIDWLDGRIQNHRNNGYQARAVMEIMMAMYESLRIGDVVRLPLTTRDNPLDLMVESGQLLVEVPGRYDIRAPFPEQKA